MPNPFYTNNGKSLNREDIPHVINASKLISWNDPVMRDKVSVLDKVMKTQYISSDKFNELMETLDLQICIDETDPETYLLLTFRNDTHATYEKLESDPDKWAEYFED